MIMMERENLFETRGKVSILPDEFFRELDGLNKMKGLTPESEVFVDKCKSTAENKIHNWTYIVDHYVKDPEVALVAIRSNKRILMMVTNKPEINGGSHSFQLVWSNISMSYRKIRADLNFDSPGDNSKRTQSETTVKSWISKTVNDFISERISKEQKLNPDEPPRTKKNWDVLVVKFDPTHFTKKVNRYQARQDMEVKPSDTKKYEIYIKNLKSSLEDRLATYKAKKLPNITRFSQLKALIKEKKQTSIPRLKLNGIPYQYADLSAKVENNNVQITMKYILDADNLIRLYGSEMYTNIKKENYENLSKFAYVIEINALKATQDVNSFAFNRSSPGTYSYDKNESISFVQGMKLINELLENNNKQKSDSNK